MKKGRTEEGMKQASKPSIEEKRKEVKVYLTSVQCNTKINHRAVLRHEDEIFTRNKHRCSKMLQGF